MSLDIALIDKDDNEVLSMNWLRNPFGLCQWAEDNTPHLTYHGKDLYYVCNHWAYKMGNRINRPLFKEVVDLYWAEIQKLERGYFHFDLPEYFQFVHQHYHLFPIVPGYQHIAIKDSLYDNERRIAIPQEYFGHADFSLGNCYTLDHYKAWFKQLVDFAERLQDKNLKFYCSN